VEFNHYSHRKGCWSIDYCCKSEMCTAGFPG